MWEIRVRRVPESQGGRAPLEKKAEGAGKWVEVEAGSWAA